MSDDKAITISRPAQVGMVLAVLALIAAITLAQMPELQRYLKIRSM
ncbi:MAG TPA: hypothetical protein VLJ42_00640 [Solirubrobacteraceae bacterium]|nr:hypothetical protein [Solirubrobacteraceae bacterium]